MVHAELAHHAGEVNQVQFIAKLTKPANLCVTHPNERGRKRVLISLWPVARRPLAMCCPTDLGPTSLHQTSPPSAPSWISRHPISLWRCCARRLCGISEPLAADILVVAVAIGIQNRGVAMYVFLPYIVVNASPTTEPHYDPHLPH